MKCASITITMNPEAETLFAQLDSLPDDWIRVVVDNGSDRDSWPSISEALESRPNVRLIRLQKNLGLSAAQNLGMRKLAEETQSTHILLLDQDSVPDPGAALRLAAAYRAIELKDARIGAVGPALIDPKSGLKHHFHSSDTWRWKRVQGEPGETVPCSSLNGSGTFMSLSFALSIGGLDEGLFIDLIDAEWSFRIISLGHSLYGVPESIFQHQMGEFTKKLWLLGSRTWPVRTPLRHRYLFRNYIKLLNRDYVPTVWKYWAMAKMLLIVAVFCITGPQRFMQLKQMAKGIADGLADRQGIIY